MYSIYKLSVGNHFYIGCTKNVETRIAKHRYKLENDRHINPKLQEAFNKSSEFDWEILCEVEEKKEAFKIERGLIKKEKENTYCCNVISKEESGFKGKKHSESARKKMSIANKGKKVSKSTREKISKIHKGKKVSKATKEKIRQTLCNTIYHCPHCDMSSRNLSNMKRWHFDNCRHKSSNNNNHNISG